MFSRKLEDRNKVENTVKDKFQLEKEKQVRTTIGHKHARQTSKTQKIEKFKARKLDKEQEQKRFKEIFYSNKDILRAHKFSFWWCRNQT